MIKVAITGTGFMGTVHTEALKRLRGIELIGIQGSTPEKSKIFAEELELPNAYATYDDLVADPEVDAVHITTPNRLHFEQAVKAFEAGKHVLCEKPLAMTSQETKELVKLAKEKNLAAGVNYNIRFYPINLEAKERVKAGELGNLHSVFGSYQQDWLLYDTDYNWRVLAEEQGELRAIADIGTHWIDLVQNITGRKVEEVFADLKVLHPIRKRPLGEVQTFTGKSCSEDASEAINITTDDYGTVLLRLEGGVKGALFVSQVTPGLKNFLRYEISGSSGAVQWNSEEPNQIWRGYREKANEILFKDPSLNHPNTRHFTGSPGGHAEGFADSHKMCFKAFYDSIVNGTFSESEQHYATFADGHREVALCDAILKSQEEECWVQVS